MKRLLCAVAAIALMAPATATAQPPQNDRQHSNRSAHDQSGQKRQRPQNGPARHRPNHERPTIQPVRPNRAGRPHHGRPTIQPVPNRPSRPVYHPGHRPPSYHRIRARAFVYPHGYGYRRYHAGLVLPHVFLSSPYYWSDWRALGLLPPPPGYVWVRFGPDLLLVNRFTGRIADVIYGAFY
jgi:Ni/Co efflux regulator RcnB